MSSAIMLKADFHVHTSEDPEEAAELSAHELIDAARARGFDVLSITNHNMVTFDGELSAYARERGILLLPGVEISVEGRKHVLVINSALRGSAIHKRVRTFGDLAALRRDETLVIAPHPFHRAAVSLGGSLEKHVRLFDAVEASHFYSRLINLNRKAARFSAAHGLALIGTSDAHFLFQLGVSYALVDAERNAAGVISAVKAGRVRCVNPPLSPAGMAYVLFRMFQAGLVRRLRNGMKRRPPRRPLIQ